MNNGYDLSTGQIARYCHVSKVTVLKWIREGRLLAYTLPGGYHRIQREALTHFLTENKMPIREDILQG